MDIAGTSDRLAGVGRSGRVYSRERSGWEQLDALADVVEIAPLGDELVALSIPERYTVLPDNGRKPQPLPTLAQGRGAFRAAFTGWGFIGRDVSQLRPSLFEEGVEPEPSAMTTRLPSDCHAIASRGRRQAVLCGLNAKPSLHLSLDGGQTLAERSVPVVAPGGVWRGSAILLAGALVQVRPCASTTAACTHDELLVAEVSEGGFVGVMSLPWPHAAAPSLVWRPAPTSPWRALHLDAARARNTLVVEEWSDGSWAEQARHPLPSRELGQRGGTRHAPTLDAHQDASGALRILEKSDALVEGAGWTADWSYTTLTVHGSLVEQHLLPRAVAAAASGSHVVLWPALGTVIEESADAGATFSAWQAPALSIIQRPEEVKVTCGPRGCTFGEQATRLGWPSISGSKVDAARPWTKPPPSGLGGSHREVDRCTAEDPIALRCVATELPPSDSASRSAPSPRRSDATGFGGLPHVAIGGRDALLRTLDTRTGTLELMGYGPLGTLRTLTLPGCTGADSTVFANEEGVVCIGSQASGGAVASWYASASEKTGRWKIPAPKGMNPRDTPRWSANVSRDGLAVWGACCNPLEVAAGPWSAASPTLFRSEGATAAWTAEGLISWLADNRSPVRRSTLDVQSIDGTGALRWKLNTLAGRRKDGPRDPAPAYEVHPVLYGPGLGLRSEAWGAGGRWASIAPIEAGTVGQARRVEPLSFVTPPAGCTAVERSRDPHVEPEHADADRTRVEIRGALGDTQHFRPSAESSYGLAPPCVAAWTLDPCDRADGESIAVLDGDRRAGFVVKLEGDRVRRFRLACGP